MKHINFILSGLLVVALSSCSGGGTDGSGENFDGTGYVNSSGSINVDLNEETVPVGGITGFSVKVLDTSDQPVSNVQITCDTEAGLALTEPTSGFELTDSNGQMSGKVGCTQPGSYQIACRLPVGSNKRDFKTVICDGPVPAGFTGFPGAGGGTLGVSTGTGGSVPGSAGGESSITGVTVSENGADTASIDVIEGQCAVADRNGDGDTTDACDHASEPFTDTLVKFNVANNTAESLTLKSFRYTISSASGSGASFQSQSLGFQSGGLVPANGTATISGLLLRAIAPTDGNACSIYGVGARKVFTGSSTPISKTLGFRNVTFTILAESASGETVSLGVTAGLAFGSYNKCSS